MPSIEEGMHCLHQGKVDQGIEVLERAARLSNPEIFSLLGRLMETEEYGERDCARAISYYQLGIKHGDRKVCPVRLGRLYLTGDCVSQDFPAAVDLFHTAAMEGYELAFLGLGMAYTFGAKSGNDFQQGRGAYLQALRRGNLLSIGLIGDNYQRQGAVLRGLCLRFLGAVVSFPFVLVMPNSSMVKSL